MLIPEFGGGLGNHMFQMAGVYSLAKHSGHSFGIQRYRMPPAMHSFVNYGATIFKNTHHFLTPRPLNITFSEEHATYPFIESLRTIPDTTTVSMKGYWHWPALFEPYRDEIVNMFHLDTGVLQKPQYSDIDNGYFLHVRRGDYVNNSSYAIDTEPYYKNAIARFPSGSVAHIVSNDLRWCRDWSLLNDVRHVFVAENDVDTLSVMKHCSHGGIAVNSTFSWWGLYLNTARPLLCLPSVWCPNLVNTEDQYVFPEVTIIPL